MCSLCLRHVMWECPPVYQQIIPVLNSFTVRKFFLMSSLNQLFCNYKPLILFLYLGITGIAQSYDSRCPEEKRHLNDEIFWRSPWRSPKVPFLWEKCMALPCGFSSLCRLFCLHLLFSTYFPGEGHTELRLSKKLNALHPLLLYYWERTSFLRLDIPVLKSPQSTEAPILLIFSW